MQDGIIECEKIVGFKNGKQKGRTKMYILILMLKTKLLQRLA